jgi:glycosyltransferase involved in cell wall biosynthesis
MARDLVILRGGDRLRWGGDLRRRYLFDSLGERPRTTVVAGWGRSDVRAALAPYRRRRWEVWRRGPTIVSAELLDPGLLELVRRIGVPLAVDVHDEPALQAEALGVGLPLDRVAELRERLVANMVTFSRTIVPSESFRRLAGIDARRAIVAPNGTDTHVVRPVAAPPERAIAFISGAAPARGIESLIEAARLVRDEIHDTRLLLYLTATGDDSSRYLGALVEAHHRDGWIEIGPLAYTEVGAGLGRATVLCIPTPSHP